MRGTIMTLSTASASRRGWLMRRLWRAELGFKELRDGLLFYQCCLDMSRRIPIQKRAWEVGAVLDT